jgi:hypothetical protein
MAMSQTSEIAIHCRRSRQDNPNPMSAQRGARTGVPCADHGDVARPNAGASVHRQEKRMQDRSAATRVGVVTYPGVEAIDIGGTVGFILMARRMPPAIDHDNPCEPRSEAIAGGLTVLVESGFADAPECDPVIVCGGSGWVAAAEDPALCAFLRRRPARVHRLCLHWRVSPGRHRRTRWAGCHGPPPCRRR